MAGTIERAGARVHVDGIVQGVGFRPFVFGLATELGLEGWVKNTSSGVDIAVDGSPTAIEEFVDALEHRAPPLAQVHQVHLETRAPAGFEAFEIIASQSIESAFQPISPDVSICPDCLRELMDPGDRRYRYPFINCTNCGPRFTIIRDIPYDRPKTTMARFEMCPGCRREYEDPLDRRFHAQPVACPTCGPQVWLEVNGERMSERNDAIQAARKLLRDGQVVAIKGLGGFHLACDATNPAAVDELRRRKGRVDKPFALMMASLGAIEARCRVRSQDRELLESRERPIVILDELAESDLAASVAPAQATVGVMLPYTPLHVLLLEPAPDFPAALVMTSGNRSEEPIATDNDDARQRLGALADAFLMHNRDIHTRCDDSVVRIDVERPSWLRRSRGYAPSPLPLPADMPPTLAAGAELKNTFCLTRDRYAFLSQHIGDMENYETLSAFEDGVLHMERLFRIRPEVVAYDLHPKYLASTYARERAEADGLPSCGVQHHHAHIASAMADAGLAGDERVIGVAFDGTGYGDDGTIWGGEILLADYLSYERPIHLRGFPMAGGDAAVKEPWRLALSLLRACDLPWQGFLEPISSASAESVRVLDQQLASGINVIETSSIGRLFDAVASLAGVRQRINYEAQAAIELEAAADPAESGAYPFTLTMDGLLDMRPMVIELLEDISNGTPVGQISTRFHRGLALITAEACRQLSKTTGIDQVALSGGVWQNRLLLRLTMVSLTEHGLRVIRHRQVPANDGGLALGQALVAGMRASHGYLQAA